MTPTIALVGDYSPDVLAHRAIPRALELARTALDTDVIWQWFPTLQIRDAARDLAVFTGIWVVPASPYENTAGAFAAIRFARETKRPFLGTCGGFQHALIEFARNAAGLRSADHAETNPRGDALIVTPLACSLVEKSGDIHFSEGSQLRAIYDQPTAHESYHCNYGFNRAHRAMLENAGMRFTAFDGAGDVRGAELPEDVHPFFIGTLFQPERAALRGEAPPLVRAFLDSVVRGSAFSRHPHVSHLPPQGGITNTNRP
jgi:CTP synthase (UTP-ammonia lyase)